MSKIGYSLIVRDESSVEILEEHGEIWIEVPESDLGRRDDKRRACVSIGHMTAALEDAGYTVTAPDWCALAAEKEAAEAAADKPPPKVHP